MEASDWLRTKSGAEQPNIDQFAKFKLWVLPETIGYIFWLESHDLKWRLLIGREQKVAQSSQLLTNLQKSNFGCTIGYIFWLGSHDQNGGF